MKAAHVSEATRTFLISSETAPATVSLPTVYRPLPELDLSEHADQSESKIQSARLTAAQSSPSAPSVRSGGALDPGNSVMIDQYASRSLHGLP